MAIFRGEAPDRPAVKLWGAGAEPKHLNAAYRRVRRAALQKTDLFVGASSPFNLFFGAARDRVMRVQRRPTSSKDWVEEVTTVRTPSGLLQSVYTASTRRRPGYQKEHLLKEPSDIRKLMSVPYHPFPFDARPFRARDRALGEAGVASYSLDHAMYGLERSIGSVNFALWSVDRGELLLEATAEYARRIREHVKSVFEAGIAPVFSWVGPELCIPPLMSPADFERYVFAFDKPLVDLIHEGGGKVWVHCHGKMRGVIGRFAEMGVDVLNPIEPPPMGDLTLAEAFDAVGDRMGLEGNIETHDLMTASPVALAEKIHAALDAGRGRRLILCASSSYFEDPEPPERLIGNLTLYVDEAVRYAETLRVGSAGS